MENRRADIYSAAAACDADTEAVGAESRNSRSTCKAVKNVHEEQASVLAADHRCELPDSVSSLNPTSGAEQVKQQAIRSAKAQRLKASAAPAESDDKTIKQAAAVASKAAEEVQHIGSIPEGYIPSQRNDMFQGAKSREAERDRDRDRERDSVAKMAEREPVKKTDRFSIEIIKCRAVCPDWQDNTFNSAFNSRNDTLVLGIPHFVLQLPLSSPAVHPQAHPVQVGNTYRTLADFDPFRGLKSLPTCWSLLDISLQEYHGILVIDIIIFQTYSISSPYSSSDNGTNHQLVMKIASNRRCNCLTRQSRQHSCAVQTNAALYLVYTLLS